MTDVSSSFNNRHVFVTVWMNTVCRTTQDHGRTEIQRSEQGSTAPHAKSVCSRWRDIQGYPVQWLLVSVIDTNQQISVGNKHAYWHPSAENCSSDTCINPGESVHTRGHLLALLTENSTRMNRLDMCTYSDSSFLRLYYTTWLREGRWKCLKNVNKPAVLPWKKIINKGFSKWIFLQMRD